MKKILAIDDDPINRQLLEIYLIGDFDYTIVSNARAALDRLHEESFDLVISDVNLEGKEDGIWLGKQIKSNPLTQHIPVVAFTAHAMNYFNLESFHEAFNTIIEKPIMKQQFVERVNELIEALTK
ncbi:MAG: response regulator [Bacteroidia bacterium]|nr:response regulator [Bacteroidia bacterium]